MAMASAGLLAGGCCSLGRACLPWGGALQVFMLRRYPLELQFFAMVL